MCVRALASMNEADADGVGVVSRSMSVSTQPAHGRGNAVQYVTVCIHLLGQFVCAIRESRTIYARTLRGCMKCMYIRNNRRLAPAVVVVFVVRLQLRRAHTDHTDADKLAGS